MKKRVITALTIFILLALYTCPIQAVASTYNLRDYIQINIKDQADTGACWILAMSTAFETNLLLKNQTRYEVSARHMDYATSQSFIGNEINEMGFAKKVDSGGTAEVALAYLTNGSGPIPESQMPFSGKFEDIYLSEIQNKTVEYQVGKWVQFPSIIKKSNTLYTDNDGNQYTTEEITSIRNQIKQHIIENGAAYAGINAAVGFSTYYNSDTYAYNCNDYSKSTDHAVVIIGWDDNYSRYKFKQNCIPSTDGAYIVQNSWGNDSRLNNGTFYISYEDAIIETGVYGIVDIHKKNYTNLYQYDELGRNQYFEIKGTDEAYGANVFERKTTGEEYITKVAISTYMQVDCEIYINPEDATFSEKKLIKTAETTIEPGYSEVTLDNPVKLTGEKFVVLVKYKKADDILGITTISNYTTSSGTNPYAYMTSNAGESYIGTKLSNMRDFYTSGSKDTNVCIKAFTVPKIRGDINGDGKLSISDLSLLQLHLVRLQILEDKTMADINEDGRVSISDLSLLMRLYVGLV